MAKKSKKKEELLRLQEIEEQQRREKELETEAYSEATPDAGMETTFTKVVGSGGPVPIVAPKHTTVQLQPIIVPLAVVPYMSSDSDVLKTEGRPGEGSGYESARYAGEGSSAEFKKVEQQNMAKAKQKAKVRKRLLSLFTLAFALVGVAYFILAHFVPNIFATLGENALDPIGDLASWVSGDISPSIDQIIYIILYMVSFAACGLTALGTFIGLLSGRYSGGLHVCFALLAFIPTLVAIVMYVAKNTFNISADAIKIFVAALTFVKLMFIIILAAINRKKEDDAEEELERTSAVI